MAGVVAMLSSRTKENLEVGAVLTGLAGLTVASGVFLWNGYYTAGIAAGAVVILFWPISALLEQREAYARDDAMLKKHEAEEEAERRSVAGDFA
jgi:hypothetical protein